MAFVVVAAQELCLPCREFSDLVLMGLACGERIDFAFAFEKHGILAYYSAEFLIGLGVDY